MYVYLPLAAEPFLIPSISCSMRPTKEPPVRPSSYGRSERIKIHPHWSYVIFTSRKKNFLQKMDLARSVKHEINLMWPNINNRGSPHYITSTSSFPTNSLATWLCSPSEFSSSTQRSKTTLRHGSIDTDGQSGDGRHRYSRLPRCVHCHKIGIN